MKQSDREKLERIVKIWSALRFQIEERSITKDSLMADEFLQWAVTTPLYNIGEQVYGLSQELKDQHPDIPWRVVSGLRHRLVHNYEGINWSIIVEIVFDEMGDFVASVASLTKE